MTEFYNNRAPKITIQISNCKKDKTALPQKNPPPKNMPEEEIPSIASPSYTLKPGINGIGPARNPSELYIARLIRGMNAGSGAIGLEDGLNIDDPDFNVSYGDYLLYVDFQPQPGAYCLMRNYAGQEAMVPTMMLQQISSPWALRSDVLKADGTPLDMAFLEMDSHDDEAVDAIDKKTWQDLECVHVSKNGKMYKSFLLSNEVDELVIVDVERNFATLQKNDLDYIAPRFILYRPFKRPWNILVDETKILASDLRYRGGQERPGDWGERAGDGEGLESFSGSGTGGCDGEEW